MRDHGAAAAGAAVDVKKLNEQLRIYRDMLLSVRSTNEYQAAYAAWQKDLDQINREITAKGAEWDARRDELRLAAAEKYFARIRDIGQKAAAEAAEAQRKLDEAMRPEAQDVSRMQGPPQPQIPRMPELTAIQRQLIDMHAQFAKLNELKMAGFHGTLDALQQHIGEFVSGASQAFAAFFADLVSGQEASAKKFLAAMIGMVGQVLVQQGTLLMTLGIMEVIAASMLFGRVAGANAAAGAVAIAKGAAIAAVGGALMGAASALANTNQAGAGASFQQAAPRPTSSKTQVIQVGAAGRAQSAGEAAATKPSQPAEVVLRVESNDSHIVKVVEKNAGANGRLRLVMAHG